MSAEREQHRRELEHTIHRLERELAGADDPELRAMLAHAHAERAEDARRGGGQLSLSAQRAPTYEGCDEGWQRVEGIVANAEASARAAALLAATTPKAANAARKAEASARAARRIVEERNHAFTFHTDPSFSFGEGWYVAAAGVLMNAAIQIEPGQPATAQAERFLRDAGLASQLRPYRSRPRAVKQTTDLIARAFRADPHASISKLRAAFLGDAPIADDVMDWCDRRVSGPEKKVLLWVRDGAHDHERNTDASELAAISERLRQAQLVPVLVGDALRDGPPPGAIDLLLFWKDPIFQRDDGRRAQLQFFEHLRTAHGVVGQIGVTTAGMDGPALMGLPTIYLTEETNVRMREWVGAVPGYCEVVRDGDRASTLERVLDHVMRL